MKRFLMYLMTYILITFSTAFGVVLISNPTKATHQTINVGGNSSATEADSPLTYIVDNFTTLKGLQLNANVDLVINEQPINLLANVTVDLNNGFENVALTGTLTVTLNENPTDIDFTYVDGTIYVSMLNGNYQITTSNLTQTITQVLTLLNVEIPDMGLDLENLDMNSLMGLLNNVTETKTDTGTTLSVYIPGLGNASVMCDLNYQIKKISLPKTTLDGFTFKVNVGVSYPTNCAVNKPEENHINLTHVFNLAEGIANFVTQNKIAVNAVINYNNQTISGNLIVDTENKNVNFNTVVDNKPLNVTLINNVVYVEFENVYVKADLTRIGEVINLFEQQFGISLPLEQIGSVMAGTSQIELNTEQFNLENFDINSIDLGILEQFTYDNGVYTVKVKDNFELTFTFDNHEFNNIKFVGYGAEAQLTAIIPTEIKLNMPAECYADVYEALPTLNALLNTLKLKHHYGTLGLTINNQTFNANYNVYVNDGLTMQVSTNVLNTPINLNITDNKIYLSFMDVNIVCDKNDITELTNFINTYFEISTPEINLTDIKDVIEGVLNSTSLLISEFKSDENGLNLEVLSKYKLTINHSNLIEGLKFETNGINVNATISSDNQPLTLNLNEDKFVNLSTILSTTNNLINYVKGGAYYFNTTLTIENFTLTGFVNIYNISNNGANIEAQFETVILGKTIKVKLLNNVVYLELDGLNLQVKLSELDKLISFVENNFGEELADLTSQALNSLTEIELPTSLEGLNVKLTNNNLAIAYNNANVNIDLSNNNLQNVNVTYENVVANIEITNQKQNITLESSYINLTDLLPFAQSIINTINAGQLEGSAIVIIDNFALNTKFKVAFKDELQVWIQTQLNGATIKINYYNEQILVSIDDLHVKLAINEIDKLTELLNTTFGINISASSIIDALNNLDINSLIDQISLGDFANIGTTPTSFGINTYGVNVFMQFNNYLNKINLTCKNVYAEVKLTAFNTDVYMPRINTAAYDPIINVLEAATSTYNGIISKNIAVNGNITINDFLVPINVKVLEDETLKIEIDTTLYNKNLNVVLIDETIYATIDGFKVKYNLNNVNNLIDLINETFNIDINEMLNDLTETDINLEDLIKDLIITNLSKTNFTNGFNLNLALMLNNEIINVDAGFTNNKLSNICLNYNNINANLNVEFGSVYSIDINTNSYETDLNDVSTLLTPVNNLLNAQQLELTGNLTFNLLGDNYTLTLTNVKVDYSNLENVKAIAQANFLGFDITLAYLNNTIYVGADNLKTYIKVEEIEDLLAWVNTTFDLNAELPKQESTSPETLTNLLNSFTLGELIKSITKTPNGVMINLPNYYNENGVATAQEIVVSYNQNFTNIIINHKDVYAELNFVNFGNNVGNVEFNGSELKQFAHYTELTNLVETVTTFVTSKQYAANAQALVYNGETLRYDVNLGLKIDVLDNLKVDGYADVKGEQNVKFDLDYWNQYLFINYEGLKLKINEQDIKGLLSVILNLFGVDPSLIPFLEDAANDLNNVNFDSISNLIPAVDFGNPISLLTLISDLSFQDGSLKLTIDGSQLSENPNAKEMYFSLNVDGNQVTNLSLTNLYTGVTEDEFFNLNINISEFSQITGLTETEQATYHDLSGSTELIKAVINTAELNYYEIDGSVIVNGNLIGIDINWDIPLNVKIKLDEQRKPEIMFTLGTIPAVVGVNNDVPYKFGDTESGSDRMVYIYYKDEYVYFHRTEYVDIMFGAGKRRYEKKLKEHISTVLEDPLYYLQYCVGFSDSIMDAIKASLELSKGRTPNAGNVLNSFVVKDKTNFTLDLNMQEITNDPKMGNMVIGIGVINTAETNNKNYVGNATFSMLMPLADAFKLTLSSKNLKLINIGKELDFTNLYNYINSYAFAEGKEYDATWNKNEDGKNHDNDWTLASEKTYVLTFEENGGATVNDITATFNSNITLPNYTSNLVTVDESTGTRTSYRFDGWFTTSNFKDGTQFTQTTMPRGDKTLYAKWTVVNVEYVRTITFNSNGGSSIASVSELAGVWIDLSYKVPTKANTYVDKGYNWVGKNAGKWTYEVTSYTFAGWYTDSSLTTKFNGYVPNYNTTLYAKWTSSVKTEYYYNWERP